MADKLFLSLVTPEKEMVIDPDVDQVNIPGSEGDLGILADHAPLFTILRPGRFSYQKGEEEIELVISHGYAEVTNNRVTVLAESAEFLQEVDHDRAEAARAAAEKVLEKAGLEEKEFKEAQDKLFRALARLETKK
ncbi:MAG: F0F1 ATP synthase subunit epsilon, partial [Nitrospinota bacterium]|nr:F0F1 ATP synthase subunit epsilon [Nitrospinota bacterium]